MRDNEKIIETLAALQQQFKEAAIVLIEADAPPNALLQLMHTWGELSEVINNLSEPHCGIRESQLLAPELMLEMLRRFDDLEEKLLKRIDRG